MTALTQLAADSDSFAEDLNRLLERDEQTAISLVAGVDSIIHSVRDNGDEVLLECVRKWDNFDATIDQLIISPSECQTAWETLPEEQQSALQTAADRIRAFHEKQLATSWDFNDSDGNRLGQKVTPIKRVGLYVPGGKASYPSSVLMNAIPANVAGVQELIMVSPTPNGVINPMVLAAAHLGGVDNIFRVGGAHAIAALAWGTETIPAVDKIVGPGNAYVTEAKRQVFGKVGIDMLAGPSEVLVVFDETANTDWVAMDLLAQAEHDEQAQSIAITDTVKRAQELQASIDRLLPDMPRAEIIKRSLKENGAIIIADKDEFASLCDQIAAEHLELMTENAAALAEQVNNAGAIFIGPYSAESLGDYCAGPNHVLPTSGAARFSSPLGVYDFQRRSSIIECSPQGSAKLAEVAETLARSESLEAHAQSASLRRQQDKNTD
ncbi:MAG: histidinol dehydrogenase [Proteobacteria bacterium]|jgi:histidinol dehydrogenase|nr:histidinol dehydrogenase [Pseudomonadota bacterium]